MLIWANFKMNKTTSELKDYLQVFKEKYGCFINMDLMIAPVLVGLAVASEQLKDSCIDLWAQNMFYEDLWAYTWEISPNMLIDLSCKYVILGHSERRSYFWESNELVNKKVLSAIWHGIRPILCIWETIDQKNKGIAKEVLKIQLLEWLYNVWDISQVDIAYEPVRAIGTGETAAPEYIEEIHNFIRSIIWENNSRIIYGWSVKAENAKSLINIKNVNGFLIGSASLNPDSLLKIVEEVL